MIMNKRNGGMLIAVTVTMVAIGVLGAAMVSVVRTSSRRGLQHSFDERAYYVARGGVAYARSNARTSFAGAVFSLGAGDEFVLTMTNDGQYAYADVIGKAGAGTVWEAHYPHEQVRLLIGTGEGLGPGLSDNYDEGLRTVGDDTRAAWVFPAAELAKDDTDRLFTTEVEILTEQGWRSSNYLTFQNFTEVITDQGFIANLVPSAQIDPAARDKDFYGIWGNASDNIYVVGEDGTIVHYDGTSTGGIQWKRMTSPTAQLLRAVWGVPRVAQAGVSERMVAVGNNGEMLEYVGGAWSRVVNTRAGMLTGFNVGATFSRFDLHGVYGNDWDLITTYGDYGGSPYKWAGPKPWRRYMGAAIPPSNSSADWPSRTDSISASIWRPYDEFSWRYRMFKGNWEWKVGANNHIFSVGHDRDASWNRAFIFKEKPDSSSYYIRINGMHTANAIWGSSLNDVFVAGRTAGGAGGMLRSSDALRSDRWNWMTLPAVPSLNGVYRGSADYVFAGGDAGTLLFFNGSTWSAVKGQDGNNITPNDINSVWGTAQTGLYGVGDNGTIVYLGYPSNPIGGYMLPLNNNPQFVAHWSTNKNFLSYTIQAKQVWGDDLNYAAAGFNFRWRLAAGTTNRFEGYGVSFMRYAPSAAGINDQIPNSIKPAFQSASEKADRLLVVLWQQTVSGGNEQRRWIAYKDLTGDALVASGGRLRDLSTLMVRAEETFDRNNRVTVYYGNASTSLQAGDAIYNNTRRLAYNPAFGTPAGTTRLPPFDVRNWAATGDYFTVVGNVSVEVNPQPGNYWILNPAVPESSARRPVNPETEGHEILLSDFHSPEVAPFGSQAARPEAGLHVFGDIGDHGTQKLISFAEFHIQLGVDR